MFGRLKSNLTLKAPEHTFFLLFSGKTYPRKTTPFLGVSVVCDGESVLGLNSVRQNKLLLRHLSLFFVYSCTAFSRPSVHFNRILFSTFSNAEMFVYLHVAPRGYK